MLLSHLIVFAVVLLLAVACGALAGGIIGGLSGGVMAMRAKTREAFLVCLKPSVRQGMMGAILGSSLVYLYWLSLIISGFQSSHDALVAAAVILAWVQFTGLSGIVGAIKGAIAGMRQWRRFQNGVKRGEYRQADAKRFFQSGNFQPGDPVIWQKPLSGNQTIPSPAVVVQVTPWRIKIATHESPNETVRVVRHVSPKSLQQQQ